jgi:hypothetical protein
MAIDWLVGRARHFAGAQRRRDGWPFAMTVLFFLASFATLAVLFWPYMIPYSITVGSAAAPEASLSFLFWGADLFVLPVIAIYTLAVYWFFRGKMQKGYGETQHPSLMEIDVRHSTGSVDWIGPGKIVRPPSRSAMSGLRRFETSLKRLKCANTGRSPTAPRKWRSSAAIGSNRG